jgi:nucleotide-binding universal stress UspA family protein
MKLNTGGGLDYDRLARVGRGRAIAVRFAFIRSAFTRKLFSRDRASKEIAMTDKMSQKMKLLIAYDGSSFADVALDDLLRAGLPSEAEAFVLSVADVWGPPASSPAYDQATSELDKELRARVQELRKRVAAAVDEARALAMKAAQQVHAAFPTWETRAESCYGSPAWELIKKAEEWQADLLITGTRGRGAMGRLLLGSVSQKVINEARCSVRIARPHTGLTDAPPRVLIAVDGSEHAEAAARATAARVWPAGTEIRLIAADDPFNHPPPSQLMGVEKTIGTPSPLATSTISPSRLSRMNCWSQWRV